MTTPLMPNPKKLKLQTLIGDRLQEMGFAPYPKALLDLITSKAEAVRASTVADVVKDKKSVAVVLARLASSDQPEMTTEEAGSVTKSKTGRLVVARLREINFFPFPDSLIGEFAKRIEAKESDVVGRLLKDHKALAGFVEELGIKEPPKTDAVPPVVASPTSGKGSNKPKP